MLLTNKPGYLMIICALYAFVAFIIYVNVG